MASQVGYALRTVCMAGYAIHTGIAVARSDRVGLGREKTTLTQLVVKVWQTKYALMEKFSYSGGCMKAKVAERGQITIPKSLRERLGIKPGTVLDFEESEGRLVAVKAVSADPVNQSAGRNRPPGLIPPNGFRHPISGGVNASYYANSYGALRCANALYVRWFHFSKLYHIK